jgi:hypothetical protein
MHIGLARAKILAVPPVDVGAAIGDRATIGRFGGRNDADQNNGIIWSTGRGSFRFLAGAVGRCANSLSGDADGSGVAAGSHEGAFLAGSESSAFHTFADLPAVRRRARWRLSPL